MKPSLHHPYVQMVVFLELRDVLTVMVNSLHHPYVQIILNQEILGCSNNDETFSPPSLCANGGTSWNSGMS